MSLQPDKTPTPGKPAVKPCPFCGADIHQCKYIHADHYHMTVECQACKARGPLLRKDSIPEPTHAPNGATLRSWSRRDAHVALLLEPMRVLWDRRAPVIPDANQVASYIALCNDIAKTQREQEVKERVAREVESDHDLNVIRNAANALANQGSSRIARELRAVAESIVARKIDPEWSLHDRVEFALRDAGFDYDEASRIAIAATTLTNATQQQKEQEHE